MSIKFNLIKWIHLNPVVKSLLYWVLFMLSLLIVGGFISPIFPEQWERFIYGIFGTIAAIGITWVFVKWEGKSFRDYNLVWKRSTLFNFSKGMVIGVILLLFIIGLLVLFSDIELVASINKWNIAQLFWMLAIIPLALMEEIAFRSYPFLELNHRYGLRLTQWFVAIAFASYHIVQGWNISTAFLGPAIWAFVFGLGAIVSRGIALPTGIHVALNIGQQVFGMQGENSNAIWILKQPEGSSAEAIARTDQVGLMSQIIILVLALIATEYYIRSKRMTLKESGL
ncbi:MAG: CPBP family intramembrane metalloprotease [Saprospiraceae bacterium]|jgi:uncharacterized protein|nr:CPBP family intramembrane metalloprotease [Saprospiraceae bacterium]